MFDSDKMSEPKAFNINSFTIRAKCANQTEKYSYYDLGFFTKEGFFHAWN